MKRVNFIYDKFANGWVSDEIKLSGDTLLKVSLTEAGVLVIKKKNDKDAPSPKVLVSAPGDTFEIPIHGDTRGKIIRVITSSEPSIISYTNI